MYVLMIGVMLPYNRSSIAIDLPLSYSHNPLDSCYTVLQYSTVQYRRAKILEVIIVIRNAVWPY